MMANKNSYKKSSFGPAFLFLEKARRTALADYYEFCRLMDDIADEPDVKNPEGELSFWKEEVSKEHLLQIWAAVYKRMSASLVCCRTVFYF